MTSILSAPFLNRIQDSFDPNEWYQLVPKGVFPISRKEADGKVRIYEQVVDETAITRIVTAFTNRKGNGSELLIDFEHFSHDTGKSSSAAGWISAMEARADGVWYKARWSDEGEAAIKNRRYRYISPVWFPSQTEALGGNRFRPTQVNDAGLTNKPNLGDALQPFWNRVDDSEFHGREATTKANTQMIKVTALLGLAATATEDEIVTGVQALKNRIATLEPLNGQLTSLQTEHTALKNRFNPLLAASVEGALTTYKGVIAEASKEAWKNRLTADFDGTVELLKGIKSPEAKKPVHQPGAVKTSIKIEGEDAFLNRSNAITARATELKAASPTRTFDSCWQQAQRETPAAE